jgi:serine/threonine-protein kinase
LLSLRSDIPPALEQVVQKAMAKEPEDRFASMEELADALSSFSTLSGRPQLTAAGVAYSRTTTPHAWESSASGATAGVPSKGVAPRTWALLAGAVAASVFVSYLVLAPRMTGDDAEEEGAAVPHTLAPALPEEPDTPGPSPGAEPDSPSPPVASPRPVGETSAEPPPVESDDADEQAVAKPPVDSTPAKTSSSAARKKRRSAAKKSAASSARKPAKRISAAPRETAPASAPAAKPAPATRKVVLKSQHRAAVTVELKCGDETERTQVPANGQAIARVPAKDCRVTCSGLGSPSCPVALRASAGSMVIH